MGEVSEHTIIVKQDRGDDFPYLAIECSWGNDPERPCASVSCDACAEYADLDCIAEKHTGAGIVGGCGIQEWYEACGMDGIGVEGLAVRVPVANVHFDDGWWLTVSPSCTCGEPSPSRLVVHNYDGTPCHLRQTVPT